MSRRRVLGPVASSPPVSVILPTYNERDALGKLYPVLAPVVTGLGGEVIVVDDGSPDGTAAFARTLKGPPAPSVVERPGPPDLARAVLEGIGRSRAEVVVVMDSDGSHPPEAVPLLVRAVASGAAELAIGSRRVPGGRASAAPSRRLVSAAARVLARPLTRARDPMSGLFAVRRSVLERAPLAPIGYKIGLEVLVRCRPRPVLEVPITARPRLAGSSKFDRREVTKYLRHLTRLYAWRFGPPRRASSTR